MIFLCLFWIDKYFNIVIFNIYINICEFFGFEWNIEFLKLCNVSNLKVLVLGFIFFKIVGWKILYLK